MQNPAVNDTIVAVASSDALAALGIVRLSGDQALAIAGELLTDGKPPPRFPTLERRRLSVIAGFEPAVDVLWFQAPRSYTGQNLVELHMPGASYLLEDVVDACLRRGARRAGPGEFTARAYVHGKLDAHGVEAVLELIHASDELSARSAARALTGATRRDQDAFIAELLDLIALIEAGIDFVDEEDVAFITPGEALERIERLRRRLARLSQARGQRDHQTALPHVVLAGLPNAGKSTLFNALLGRPRALVSDQPGATRDVLTAECKLREHSFILQDAAGLGWKKSEIDELAAERSRAALQVADLVLWMHPADQAWTAEERTLAEIATHGRPRLLVRSKSNLSAVPDDPPPTFDQTIPCAIAVGNCNIERVIDAVTMHLDRLAAERKRVTGVETASAVAALDRACELLAASEAGRMRSPELVSAELMGAVGELRGAEPLPEVILGRIFGRFCIGK